MGTEERTQFSCELCEGSETSGDYEAREMMLGLRTRFHYTQCANCGSLWLMDPPVDFAAYYPNGYYSFATHNGGIKAATIKYLRTKRDRTYFGSKDVLGRFLSWRYKNSDLRAVSKLIAKPDTRVLDVGCGSGQLLHRMAALGFQNLVGADPYLSEDLENGNGVRIRKCRLEDMVGEKYDLVMFHHSFEHVPDPVGTLRTVTRILAPGGKCLIRLPVVAHAWERYKTNWVQLDPPRHMWLPTEKAMGILAESVGLSMQGVDYDSTDLQFWGSELYARDVPLRDVPRCGVPLRGTSFYYANSVDLTKYFRREDVGEFQKKAVRLNREGQGDQAAFYFSVQP